MTWDKNQNNHRSFFLFGFLKFVFLFFCFFSFFYATASPGVPTIISYQGRLANSSGDLLGGSGTTYYFKFSIWDNSTVDSGTKLWPSSDPGSVTATVRQGVFNVNIGDTANSYPDSLNYNFNSNKDVFLQVEVSSNGSTFQTLSPRQRITSSSFAQLASAVSGTSTPSSFGTTTPISNSIVTIEATSSNSVPISIRAFANQSVNLFQIQNSGGSNLFFINSSGGLLATSSNITYASSTALTLAGDFFGNNILQSADSYINFGTTQGTNGYGFRDNSGTLQIKNNSGSWANIPTSGTSQWTTAGSNIYYNTGNVGLGTTTPNWLLQLATSSAPQLVMSDTNAGTNLKHWTIRSAGGNLYFATSSDAYATSTVPGLMINSNGNVGIGTTSPFTSFSVAGNSYLGTVVGGAWNGTAIGVGYGGTGQTSFGQGWLHSDGTALTSSTSPTVAYIYATSTTATSTFPNLAVTTQLKIGSDYLTDITGANLSITNGVLNAATGGASPDWLKETNYGVLALTASTTLPYWAKSAIYASSTSVFQGLATFGNATATQLTLTNLYLGGDQLDELCGTGLTCASNTLALNATGDWTGTLDTYNGSDLLARANHSGTQNVSTISNYDWTFASNYGASNLTASSSSLALWARGGLNASSTSNFVYASTTALTVAGGAWFTGGNVGIGTTTPLNKLTIHNATTTSTVDADLGFTATSTGLTSYYNWTIGIDVSDAGKFKIASSTVLGTNDRFVIDGNGYLGLGTAVPGRKLDVFEATSNSQVRISQSDSVYSELFVDSAGDLRMSATGGDIRALNENLYICAGDACPTGAPSVAGNILVENNIGIGTTTPAYRLTVNSDNATDNLFQVATTTNQNIFVINSNGNAGIGSTTPWSKLSVVKGGAITVGENNIATSSTIALSWTDGNQQLVRIGTSAITINFSNFVDGQALKVIKCNPTSETAGTITWGTQVLWPGGVEPGQTTTANKCDVFSFLATIATSTLKIFGGVSSSF